MKHGHRLMLAAICAVFVLSPLSRAWALDVAVVARFAPPETGISSAALMANGHVVLTLTEQGMLADYLPDGTLHQHIVREGGVKESFRPTACSLGWDGQLYVFDEVTHSVFKILSDGNIEGSIKLKLTLSPEESTAVSAVGDLDCSATGTIWALLTDKGLLAGFNSSGAMTKRVDFDKSLPYANAAYSKIAVTADGTIYVLDHHQGAILRKAAGGRTYQRIVPFTEDGIDGAPLISDFAVDDGHNLLVAANGRDGGLMLLEQTGGRFVASQLDVGAPADSRLSCSGSAGKFIVWSRDEPFVAVLELR